MKVTISYKNGNELNMDCHWAEIIDDELYYSEKKKVYYLDSVFSSIKITDAIDFISFR